ncbi:CHAD domain-containing protein, partial [Corynebacterium casei]
AALDSDRYLELLDSLDNLLANPPVETPEAEFPEAIPADVEPAEEPLSPAEAEADAVEVESEEVSEPAPLSKKEEKAAAKQAAKDAAKEMEQVMAAHLAKAYEKLLKRHKKAVKNWDNEELTLHEREEYYHDMRKAAKKLRYAAEAAGSATKLKTKGLYAACKDMQSVLGDFQDSVTSRDKLLHLAQAARRRGEDTFGYGLLYQRERAIGLEALEDYERSMKSIKQAFKPLKKQIEK